MVMIAGTLRIAALARPLRNLQQPPPKSGSPGALRAASLRGSDPAGELSPGPSSWAGLGAGPRGRAASRGLPARPSSGEGRWPTLWK